MFDAMHAPEVRQAALALAGNGVNDCEIARRLGIPRSTVRDWRRPTYVAKHRLACPRCWLALRPVVFTAATYAELLAMYLGDGCISRLGRSYSLRISLDAGHPRVLAHTRALLSEFFVSNRLTEVRFKGTNTVVLCVYSMHMPCLFPQHGSGKKHERPIVLEAWQRDAVEAHPWRFLRGLINTDGCAFINRTGRYEYLSYDFHNLSSEILRLFTRACDIVGAEYRAYQHKVRINRRASVAMFEEYVGTKG